MLLKPKACTLGCILAPLLGLGFTWDSNLAVKGARHPLHYGLGPTPRR
jgi:hypothetical protein